MSTVDDSVTQTRLGQFLEYLKSQFDPEVVRFFEEEIYLESDPEEADFETALRNATQRSPAHQAIEDIITRSINRRTTS